MPIYTECQVVLVAKLQVFSKNGIKSTLAQEMISAPIVVILLLYFLLSRVVFLFRRGHLILYRSE
jgi:hypothetical protein